MQYKTISYRRVKNLGNYENESFELTVELEPDENPLEVTRHLRQMADSQLGLEQNIKALDDRKEELEGEVMDLQQAVDAAKVRWEKISEFMGKLGVNVANYAPSDGIPF